MQSGRGRRDVTAARQVGGQGLDEVVVAVGGDEPAELGGVAPLCQLLRRQLEQHPVDAEALGEDDIPEVWQQRRGARRQLGVRV